MQSTTTIPDSPTLSDSSKKKSSSKRAKASVACHECRKRKVKCEGIQPCLRCRKSNFRCIFPQQQSSKRGPPKQYIEILEARLQLMEKALRTIGGPASEILDDALSLDHHALQDKNGIHEDDTTMQQPNEFHPTPNSIQQQQQQQQLPDQYSMNEIGQPYYTHDIYRHQIHSSYQSPPPPQQQQRHMDLRRQPSDLSLSTNNDIKSEPTTPVPTNHCLANIDTSLIDKYFEHVHPYTPMIDMSTFTQQLMHPNNPPPMLLLYAMCAVAARWSSSYATHSNEPAGFSYYQRAFVLIDETGVTPRISTIQALVLLTKYQEHYKRGGYFYRPGYYLTLAVDMCYSLKLPTLVSGAGTGAAADTPDYETKKRTFWMTFLYDLWTSIEEGRETRFTSSQCSTDYPLSNCDNGRGSEDLVTRHNVVIRLGRILSDIYGFSRRLASRQQIQGTVRTASQQVEEEGRLVVMQTTLETYLREISVIPRFDYAPSTTDSGKYPADTTAATVPEVFVGFLHMMYHYSIILLHRHRVLYPITKQNDINTHPYPHQQLCATSASIINSIANSILESNSMDVFHYPTRGVQFTILCVTMAIAVHKFEMETAQDEHRKTSANTLYWQALSIVNRLSTETSAVELRYLARDAELAEMCGKLAVDNNSNLMQQQPLSPDGSSSFTTTNNDGSSTSSSSSPVLSSSVVSTSTGSVTDRMNRQTKVGKPPRRSTVSGSHLKRFPSQIFTPDSHHQHAQPHHDNSVTSGSATPATTSSPSAYTHVQSPGQQSPTSASSCSQPQQHSPHGSATSSTVNPAALFNSSASITDPARLASMMQFGNIPLTPYNHHQQPIQLPMQPQPQRRMPRPLHHHYSHSQEDLRSLNHRHMNKSGYARAASPGTPSESRLKKHRSMKFLPMHSQQLQHTIQQYPPPSSLHVNPQQQRIQQQQNQQYQRQQHHHMNESSQPLYDHGQNQQQQHTNYHPTPPPQPQHLRAQQQNDPSHYPQNYQSPPQNMMPTTTMSHHQMNFSAMATTPLHRRHTISFTEMDTTGFTSPMAMEYGSSPTSMMQVDAMNAMDHRQQQQPPQPQHYSMHQGMTLASSPSLSANSQPTPMTAYTPMMEDDSQMMMMATDPNTMHHLLADSSLAWGNGSLEMDRKTEGHVLQ
ncbi:unnamed protein product [Absidia cylindrospora]